MTNDDDLQAAHERLADAARNAAAAVRIAADAMRDLGREAALARRQLEALADAGTTRWVAGE